jgi:hypothetical protein
VKGEKMSKNLNELVEKYKPQISKLPKSMQSDFVKDLDCAIENRLKIFRRCA